MVELKEITKKNAWGACIAVWEIMVKKVAETPGMRSRLSRHNQKEDAVREAGFEPCEHNCPLCQVYNTEGMAVDDNCKGCPIAHYYNVQFACQDGESAYREFHYTGHPDAAVRFLAELKHIRRQDELGLIDHTSKLTERDERDF